jgi:hypothetical protein
VLYQAEPRPDIRKPLLFRTMGLTQRKVSMIITGVE